MPANIGRVGSGVKALVLFLSFATPGIAQQQQAPHSPEGEASFGNEGEASFGNEGEASFGNEGEASFGNEGEASFGNEGDYSRSTQGTRRLLGQGGLEIKLLVEAANLGGDEVELGEITFPVGATGGAHRHEVTEIFYVLSGVMGHVVNGELHRLEPGMVGIVRPGDSVAHQVLSPEPVRALVVWAPGGEAKRLSQFFEERPLAAND